MIHGVLAIILVGMLAQAPAGGGPQQEVNRSYKVVLKGGRTFYGVFKSETTSPRGEPIYTYEYDEPGRTGTTTVRLQEIEFGDDKTHPEARREREERLKRQWAKLGQTLVTVSTGAQEPRPTEEVALAERAKQMMRDAAEAEASRPIPAGIPAEPAEEVTEQDSSPGFFLMWGPQIAVGAVALVIIGIVVKLMVLGGR